MAGSGSASVGSAQTISALAAPRQRIVRMRVISSPVAGGRRSVHRLRVGKLPLASQDLRARPIKPHDVAPTLGDLPAIVETLFAAAKLHDDRSVGGARRGHAVDRAS